MCTSVISGCDPSPVFEFTEHVLDFVALLVERFVVFDLYFPIFLWRDTRLDTLVFQGIPEPIGIVAAIRQKVFGRWQGIDNQPSTFVIAHLPFRQQQDDGTAQAIANSVKFGVQAALRASDTTGNIPFLSRLAAVRWAFR